MTGHSAHTPTPWKQSLPDEILIVGPGNEDVAHMSGHYQTEYVMMEANAAFIVRACNAWYDIAALRARVAELEAGIPAARTAIDAAEART